MEKLNLTMPDDFHRGMMTPGVMDEEYQTYTMTQTSFEYLASSLIRILNPERMAIEKVLRDNDIALPDEDEDEEGYNKAYDEFFDKFSDKIKQEHGVILAQLQVLFDELWQEVSRYPFIKTWVGDDVFRILYDNVINDNKEEMHKFEIVAFYLTESDEYDHARISWNDTGFSITD